VASLRASLATLIIERRTPNYHARILPDDEAIRDLQHAIMPTEPVTYQALPRRLMTIAVGLLCRDGAVLGADQEVSLETLKVKERKAHILKSKDVVVGVVGSGSADLITLAAQELEKRLVGSMKMESVKSAVEELASEIHRKHVLANPAARHSLDLLIGIKTTTTTAERQVRLLKVKDTIVIWNERYDAIGMGGELAHYVLSGLYDKKDTLSVGRGVMLASQVLQAAKRHVQGCGGPSDVIQIQLGFVADFVHEDDVRLHEESADKFNEIMRPVMLAMTDIDVNQSKLADLVGTMSSRLNTFRSNEFLSRHRQVSEKRARGEESSSAVFGDIQTSGPPGPWNR
jgi:20S proteasome alpha/beta subunit